MIIYQNSKSGFLTDVHHHDIEEIIHASFMEKAGHRVSKEEIRSWANSLNYMGKVLVDTDIPSDCGVAVEYTIPQTSKRVDFLLTGKTAEQKSCLIIVELKQWEFALKTEKDGIVATKFSRGMAEVSHPSYQAWSYAALLENFNEAVYEGEIKLSPCAYLHNYSDPNGDICDSFYADHVKLAPVFLKGEEERRRLQDFIKSHVRYGDKAETLFRIEGGRIRPSKMLADSLVGLLNGNPEFVLIDDQKLVYETALVHARKVREKGKKVLIVEGGPGTGKSVVAINLLVGLTKAEMVAKYVTKNAAPRAVYESKLTGTFKKTHISNLFVGSGSFTETNENEFDVLIVDEAHRLNEKSGLYKNLGENQIKEIIRSSRLSIFFIDESQKVTLSDIGDKEEIRKFASLYGASVEDMTLSSQFRCGGHDGYLAWLDNTLDIRETANTILDVSEFDFRIVDSPSELKNIILEKNNESINRARMVAGYCWKWPSKKDQNSYDIVFPSDGFKARWNLTKDGGLWMVSPDSVEEVGCIHTCQGLEVDYIGVIVGDDLVVRNGLVVTNPEKRASSDKSIHGWKQLAKINPDLAREKTDLIIKNTYRTLMTRGMKGCYVYFTDKETAEYFRSRLHGTRKQGIEPRKFSLIENNRDSLPFTRITREKAAISSNAVPIVPLAIAAGQFSSPQHWRNEAEEWAELADGFSAKEGMFVAKVVGESMNKRIPNGSWCLFRANPGGTRNGKIVVVQRRGVIDPETGGSYTVKMYKSEKRLSNGDDWQHERITLLPQSTDDRFQPIVLDPTDEAGITVIAEFIAVL